jgi:hypothetical protein
VAVSAAAESSYEQEAAAVEEEDEEIEGRGRTRDGEVVRPQRARCAGMGRTGTR